MCEVQYMLIRVTVGIQVLALLDPLDSLLRQHVRDEAARLLRSMPDARVGRVSVLNGRQTSWLSGIGGRH